MDKLYYIPLATLVIYMLNDIVIRGIINYGWLTIAFILFVISEIAIHWIIEKIKKNKYVIHKKRH